MTSIDSSLGLTGALHKLPTCPDQAAEGVDGPAMRIKYIAYFGDIQEVCAASFGIHPLARSSAGMKGVPGLQWPKTSCKRGCTNLPGYGRFCTCVSVFIIGRTFAWPTGLVSTCL